MLRMLFFFSVILCIIQFLVSTIFSNALMAQEWEFRRHRGTLKVVDLLFPSASVILNYAEGLVSIDKNNKLVPKQA